MGGNTSSLAQRLVDEGLRMADHPGVLFKDGPTGRRAALAYGPDIWEVITFLRALHSRLSAGPPPASPTEDWLQPPTPGPR